MPTYPRRVITRAQFLLLSIGASGLMMTSPGFAQQPAPSEDEATPQQVVVTGSRISAPNLTSTSPIQVISSEEIQLQGKSDVIDIINNLPQNFQNSRVDFSNTTNALSTPGGFTTADLRGAGPQRTLVLVNGRRLGTADANTGNPNPAPDLDQIPAALVERVEVVTGGASATYGSDAIAGVVNFIMKRDFEGLQVDAQLATYQHDNSDAYARSLATDGGFDVARGNRYDGRNLSFSLIGGSSIADGRGNVTGYFTYLKADPITGSDRDFAGCQLALASLQEALCIGSSNSNFFRLAGTAQAYSVVGDQFLTNPQEGSSPPSQFNSNKYIYLSRGDERYTAGFMGHVDINDAAKPYFEFSFMDDRTTSIVAPSGLFRGGNSFGTNSQYDVNCSNPLLSEQQRAILCTPAQIAQDMADPGSASANVEIGRRNIEGGGREALFEHTNYRAVGGMNGELFPGWNYDAWGQYYYTSLYNANSNYLNLQSISNALQVTGTAASPTCISGSPCIPYNIFKDGAVDANQLGYLYSPGTAFGTVNQKTLHADVTADLGTYNIKSPWAEDGLAANIGVEHRSEATRFDPDAGELAGILSGFSGASAALDRSISVSEEFGEIRVPLVQQRPGVQDLVADVGYRHSKYSTVGGVSAYKLEVQYAPLRDLRLRGSYQRAIRAPNIIELYTPLTYGQSSTLSVDPCAVQPDGSPATSTFDECQRTGVTAAQYGDGTGTGATPNNIPQCVSNQCGQVTGGNEALTPEKANTYSLGVTITPTMLPTFTGSIDYYNIKLDNAIGAIPQTFALQQCLDSGDPRYCSTIVRTPIGGLSGASIAGGGYVLAKGENVGQATLKGIDVQAAYRINLPAPFRNLTFAMNGAQLLHATATPSPGFPTYDCVGLYGTTCQTLNPRWRHTLRASLGLQHDLMVSAQWRFIDSVKLESNTSQEALTSGAIDEVNGHLPAASYLDVTAQWVPSEAMSVRLGINNLLDHNPPLVTTELSGTGGPNSFPTYDLLGRQIFLSTTFKF